MVSVYVVSFEFALTETLGWIIADDFYRMPQGEDLENIIENAGELKAAFSGLKFKSNNA